MIVVDTTECLERNKEEVFCISAITIEEIYDGLGYTKVKKDKEVYDEIKKQHEKILNDFHIIPINLDIMKKTGLLRGELRAKGVIIDLADLIIMVTSQAINAKKIITRNPRHFDEAPIQVESYEIN